MSHTPTLNGDLAICATCGWRAVKCHNGDWVQIGHRDADHLAHAQADDACRRAHVEALLRRLHAQDLPATTARRYGQYIRKEHGL